MKRMAFVGAVFSVLLLVGCGQSEPARPAARADREAAGQGIDALYRNLDNSMLKSDTERQASGSAALFQNLDNSMLKGNSTPDSPQK